MALKKFPKINRLAEPNQKDFVSDVNLFNIQAEMIRELAKQNHVSSLESVRITF